MTATVALPPRSPNPTPGMSQHIAPHSSSTLEASCKADESNSDSSNGNLPARREEPAEAIPLTELTHLVRELQASWQSGRFAWERRGHHRRKLSTQLTLIPLDTAGEPSGDQFVVRTRDLSLAGLSFEHALPLAFRLVAVHICSPDGSCVQMKMRLTWCRFRGPGIYESGGQFLSLLPTNELPS